jgi:molecular chaperone HscA
LARFSLRGIPPMAAGAARIRVTFSIDADGLLSVGAKEQISGVEAQVQVKPSYGLPDGEIARMLQESFATAQTDIAARALAQARLDVDRTVLATRSALQIDGELLTPGERMEIESLITAALAAKTNDDPAPIEAANKTLAHGTEAFAAQRMNAGIRAALQGKTLDAV